MLIRIVVAKKAIIPAAKTYTPKMVLNQSASMLMTQSKAAKLTDRAKIMMHGPAHF